MAAAVKEEEKKEEKEIWSEFNVAFRAKGRERLKLQSSSLGAHDSSRSVNLRACAGLPQKEMNQAGGRVKLHGRPALGWLIVGKIPSSMRHQAFRQRILSPKMQDLLRAVEMIKESEMVIPRGRPALGRPIAKEHHQPQ